MRKFFRLLGIAVSCMASGIAQNDLSVTAILQPASGCGLSSSETVEVRVFNFGADMSGVAFDLAYTVNGGAPVVENVSFPVFLTNSTVTYTFTTGANLSAPGTYTLTAYSSVTGDVNPTNDAFTNYLVTNNNPSVGGSVAGSAAVCISGNSGTLTLSGHTGNVLNWEYSTDGGSTWITIANTSTTQNYTNLTVATRYRARVQNGSCTPAYSTQAIMTISPASVGGSVSGTATVCSGANSGNLTLSGHNGTVQNWEFSTNGGVSWTPIANTTTTQSYLNLTTNTLYRAVVKSGACASANSSNATITVNANTVGGSIAPATATVCAGSNSGTLTLSGQTGTVQNWQFSTNGGASWTTIANTTTTQNYTNLSLTTEYRATVKSGVCPSLTSATSTITVIPGSVGGTVAASATVCAGFNSGTLNLSGQSGSVTQWQFSTNGGASWTNIANTTTSQNYSNISVNTLYRAVVQNGSCPTANSSSASITVTPTTVPGSVGTSTTVCQTVNNGTLTLSGQTGNVINWESSVDGGLSWSPIANVSTSQVYTNLTQTTKYRAVVQSGVCPTGTSVEATVQVDSTTLGGTVTTNTAVCYGNNSGTVTLGSHRGSVLNWDFSNDGGLTWITISNTSTAQSYNNLIASTNYRAQVKNGVCAAQYSNPVTITIDPKAVGGTASSSATVCDLANSGVITLTGYNASVSMWQYSTNNGASWQSIVNNTPTQGYLNLPQTTWYRAITSSGVCTDDTSNIVKITVDNATIAGLLSADDTICAGSSGSISLGGNNGTIQSWYLSHDGGNTWFAIANTGSTLNYTNLNQTTSYRVNVKSGVCPADNSNAVTITVDPKAVGGLINSNATVCQGMNSGTLTLSGQTGSVFVWESSSDGGLTWNPTGATGLSDTYTNLISTTKYRVVVMSGVCANDTSSVATISVDSVSVGGTVMKDTSVCAGLNKDTLNLSNYNGQVQSWYMSNDGGASWIAIASTNPSVIYTNLNQSTQYFAMVRNGVCPAVSSDTALISIIPASNGGVLGAPTPVCQLYNSGIINVSGNNGTVTGWLSSINGGASWTPISNTGSALPFDSLMQSTTYAVIVQNNVCTPDTSSLITIVVNPKPNLAAQGDTVCKGQPIAFVNNSTITSGIISSYQWNFGNGSISFLPAPVYTYADTGNYTVLLTAFSNLGCTDSLIVPVRVNPLPVIHVTSASGLHFCYGDSITLSTAPQSNVTVLWNNGLTSATITVDSTGTYLVTATDTLTGCVNSDSLKVYSHLSPMVNAGTDITIGLGETAILSGSAIADSPITYYWAPSPLNSSIIPDPEAYPLVTTQYTLTVTDSYGCVGRDSIVVTVDDQKINLTIPTLITPNGDGFNDAWVIKNIGYYPDNEVIIFNRDGQKVFSMSTYDNSWGGTFNGNPVPDGTYYYVLKLTKIGKEFTGPINVLRSK